MFRLPLFLFSRECRISLATISENEPVPCGERMFFPLPRRENVNLIIRKECFGILGHISNAIISGRKRNGLSATWSGSK